jgi:hypothetical protein
MATVIRGDDNFDTAFTKSVAIIADVKAYNVNGGTNTAAAWNTRDLNTELDDPENIVTITSNQFTLQAGTYLIEWAAPVYVVKRHFTKLQNITDSTTESEGTTEYASATDYVSNRSTGAGIVTLTSAKTFEIQHYTDQSNSSTAGLGLGSNVSGTNSVYTLVKIHKIGA